MFTLMYYLAFKLLQNHQIYTCKCLPTKSRVNTSGNIIKKTYVYNYILQNSLHDLQCNNLSIMNNMIYNIHEIAFNFKEQCL